MIKLMACCDGVAGQCVCGGFFVAKAGNYPAKRSFSVGDIIANSADPRSLTFACGSITSRSAEGYWITMPGGGASRVSHDEAVDLVAVLMDHPDIPIVADKRFLDEKKLCAGVVDPVFSSCDTYCIRIRSGCVYIPRIHAVDAMTAVRKIIGACPHSFS